MFASNCISHIFRSYTIKVIALVLATFSKYLYLYLSLDTTNLYLCLDLAKYTCSWLLILNPSLIVHFKVGWVWEALQNPPQGMVRKDNIFWRFSRITYLCIKLKGDLYRLYLQLYSAIQPQMKKDEREKLNRHYTDL